MVVAQLGQEVSDAEKDALQFQPVDVTSPVHRRPHPAAFPTIQMAAPVLQTRIRCHGDRLWMCGPHYADHDIGWVEPPSKVLFDVWRKSDPIIEVFPVTPP